MKTKTIFNSAAYRVVKKSLVVAMLLAASTPLFASSKELIKLEDGVELTPKEFMQMYEHFSASRNLYLSTRGPSSQPLLEDALNALSKTQPVIFSNFGQGHLYKARSFQSAVTKLEDRSAANILTTHFDCLVPLVHEFREYLSTMTAPNKESTDLIEDLKDEIDFMLRPRRTSGNKPLVTPAWFLDMHARLVASFGEPSEAEKAVAWHAASVEYLMALFKNKAWQTPLKYLVEAEDFDNEGVEIDVPIGISYIDFEKNRDIFYKEYTGRVPTKTTLPMLGDGKLGIPFLIWATLNKVFPVAFTQEVSGYHGIPDDQATPVGLTMHDKVHGAIDVEEAQVEKHVLETVDQTFADNQWQGFAPDYTKEYSPIAIARAIKINSFFTHVFERLVLDVLPKRGVAEFRRIMGGYFWFIHEARGRMGTHNIYGMHGLQDAVETLVKTSIKELENEKESWESSHEPLETNPINGRSKFSNQEIIQMVIKGGYLEYPELIHSKSVSHHPAEGPTRFIDVDVKYTSGSKKRVSFATLFHKVTNIEDARGLLAWSGTDIPKLNLAEWKTEAGRIKAAKDYINTIQRALVAHLNLFGDVCKYFVLEERGGRDSLGHTYFQDSWDSEETWRKKYKN